MKTAAVINVGCRLNQAEGAYLRGWLSTAGYRLLSETAPGIPETVYINTCCVTRAAERSSAARIYQALRLAPQPEVHITGCWAEYQPNRLQQIAGIHRVIGMAEKRRLIAGALNLPSRSRALVKIQDGCDRHCSYCVAGMLRGRPRSKPVNQVVAEVQDLLARGYPDITLVGLNVGIYGKDNATTLPQLLSELERQTGQYRYLLRLSSLEPDTAALVLPAQHRLSPHFHIPLQAGDDRLLAAMGRHYTADDFRSVIRKLHAAYPQACIGTDVIVGFPGEDETAFQRTCKLLTSLPISYFHVFRYSPRAGTPAFALGDPVPPAVKQRRVRLLRSLAAEKFQAYAQQFIGTCRPAVATGPGKYLTDNYLTVMNPVPPPADHGLTAVRVMQVANPFIPRAARPWKCGSIPDSCQEVL